MLSRVCCSLLLSCALLEAACQPNTGGQGIGPPPFTTRVATLPLGIQIVQVYTGDPNLLIDPSAVTGANPNAFVQLANESDKPIVLSQNPLLLIGRHGTIDLSTLGTFAPQSRVHVDATSLNLHWAADELVVVDSQRTGQAYLAWGGVKSTLTHSLAGLADPNQQGLYVTVPMVNGLGRSIANDPNASNPNTRDLGCVIPDETRLPSDGPVEGCPTNPNTPLAQITEVRPGTNGWLEILNISGGPLNLYGLTLCYGGTCSALDADAVITTSAAAEDANNSARMVVFPNTDSDSTAATANQVNVPNLQALSATNDEVALLITGDTADNPNANFWSYVRYGDASPPQNWTPQAVAQGLWTPTGSLLGLRLDSDSISLNPNVAANVSAWSVAAATQGAPNATIVPSDPNTWTACSIPPPIGATASLVIQSIDFGTRVVTLQARTALSMGQESLANPAASVPLPTTPLAANDQLTVELSPNAPCATNPNVCWQDSNALLNYNELTVLSGTGIAAHVQWDQQTDVAALTTPPPGRGADARTTGVWAGPACRIPGVATDKAATLGDPDQDPGFSPPDYTVGNSKTLPPS